MNKEEALGFLEAHQPLPPDSQLTQSVIDKYDKVRQFFLQNPDADCVRPFLNSFGEGSGFGVYQLVGNVFEKLPPPKVIAELDYSLQSEHRGVRYWSAQIAALFPSKELLPSLQSLLREDDFDMKYAALTALEQVGADARTIVAEFMRVESEPELKSLAQEILDQI